MKISIPKLHSIEYKSGITASNIHMHPKTYSNIDNLIYAMRDAIDTHAVNMSRAEIVGAMEYVKADFI